MNDETDKSIRGWRVKRDGSTWPNEEKAMQHLALLDFIHSLLPPGFDERYGITQKVTNHSDKPRIRIEP